MTGPRAPLSFHPIAELGLSPWGVRAHFEKVEKQPSEFLNSGLVDILGQIVDSVWLRAVSSTPGLCPLNASDTAPPVTTTKNVSRHGQISPGRTKLFQVKNH